MTTKTTMIILMTTKNHHYNKKVDQDRREASEENKFSKSRVWILTFNKNVFNWIKSIDVIQA